MANFFDNAILPNTANLSPLNIGGGTLNTFNYGGDIVAGGAPTGITQSSASDPWAWAKSTFGSIVGGVSGSSDSGVPFVEGSGGNGQPTRVIVTPNPQGTSPGTSSASTNTTGASATNGSNLFVRAVVIILGFIFVAAGLHMFQGGQIIMPRLKAAP